MKISTPILFLFTLLFSQPDHEFHPSWSWNISSSGGFIYIQDVTLFSQTPDSGIEDGVVGFCPEGEDCDFVAAFYYGKCVGGSYFVDDHFLIPINFNDFITDGVEDYPSAGETVNLKIFDASAETVYHGIIDAQVLPLSQTFFSDLNIIGDGLIAAEPYACPEMGSPYFDAYAGGGNLDLYGKGDVNMSGTIDVLDVMEILLIILGQYRSVESGM